MQCRLPLALASALNLDYSRAREVYNVSLMSETETETVEAPKISGRGRRALGVDWDLIRKRFEIGMTLADCARGQGLTGESVRVKAKKLGWQRKTVHRGEVQAARSQIADMPTFQSQFGMTATKTPENAAIIIAALKKGMGFGRAAALAGLSASALSNWQAEDLVFARHCETARNEALGKVEEALYATAGKGDVGAQKFVLKTAKETREEYREEEQRVAVSLSLSFHRGGDDAKELPPILDMEPAAEPGERLADLREED